MKFRHKVFTCAGVVTVSLASALAAQTMTPAPGATAASLLPKRAPETPAEHDARMAWWREAKFGMFIHWGLYAIPADGEWHMRAHKVPLAEYKKFAARFNPTKFNADEWTALAQEAGMKYLVLTTKHHDGFAMFHSAASDYNIFDATPFKRDPLKELSLILPRARIEARGLLLRYRGLGTSGRRRGLPPSGTRRRKAVWTITSIRCPSRR